MQHPDRAEIEEILALTKGAISSLVLDSPEEFKANPLVMNSWESLVGVIKGYRRTITLPPSDAFRCFQYFELKNENEEPTVEESFKGFQDPLVYIWQIGPATWEVDCFLWESDQMSELAVFLTVEKDSGGFYLQKVRRINVP